MTTEVTKAQIAEWKRQYGELYQFSVGGQILILRQPGMRDLERASAADPKKQKPYNFHRSIIENCKLYETPGMLENERNLIAVCAKIDEIIEVADAEVKKL